MWLGLGIMTALLGLGKIIHFYFLMARGIETRLSADACIKTVNLSIHPSFTLLFSFYLLMKNVKKKRDHKKSLKF